MRLGRSRRGDRIRQRERASELGQEHAAVVALVHSVLRLITVQQGPGEVLVAVKLGFAEGMAVEQVAGTINEFEGRLRGRCPEVKWCFVEPDIPRV